MMTFIAFFQSTKNTYCIKFIWFINHYHLETTLQCLVLFKILLIFIKCCSTDSSEFTSCQSWFKNIGGIHCTFSSTSTNQGMYFINKQNDITLSIDYFLDDTFQSFLKLTFIFSTCKKLPHIQRIELLIL